MEPSGVGGVLSETNVLVGGYTSALTLIARHEAHDKFVLKACSQFISDPITFKLSGVGSLPSKSGSQIMPSPL